MTATPAASAPLLGALLAGVRRLPGAARLRRWADPLGLSHRLLRRCLARAAPFAHGRVLDVGCGTRPYADLFATPAGYVAMDLPPTREATIHGSAVALPFRDECFDTVLCTQVLEHVARPEQLIREAARVLRPGGVLILTTPQTWGLHHEPHDYYRYTVYGLRYLATVGGLEVVRLESTSGLWATLAQRLVDTVAFTYLAGRPPEYVTAAAVALAPVLAVGGALDRVCGRRGDTLDNLLLARKAGAHVA